MFGNEELELDERDNQYKNKLGFVPDSKEEYAFKDKIRSTKIHLEAADLHGF